MACKVSDEDGCSPECLFTLKSVKDPYSTDDEQDIVDESTQFGGSRKSPKLDSSSWPNKKFTYSGSDVTVQTLKRCFNLLFYSLPKYPTIESLQNQNVIEILDDILYFVTNKKVTEFNGALIIDELLKLPDRGLNILHEEKDFQVNLKECTTVPKCEKMSSTNYLLACNYMDNMVNTLLTTLETESDEFTLHHDVVKSSMKSLCLLTSGQVIESGACVSLLESAVKSKRTGRNKKVSFKANPDLVLKYSVGSDLFPGIPFEVYSPTKEKTETKPEKASSISRMEGIRTTESISTTENINTDEESQQPLSEFLSSNIPIYMCEKAQEFENSSKSKLVAQHLLQILGVASDYCYYKLYVQGSLMKKSKVFIGLFVCDEYVYITKVQGDEACFASYKAAPVIESRSRNIDDRVKQIASGRPDPRIHVQFSSIVLDLSIHNHRMALLFFLQYWMINWDDMEVDHIKNTKET